MDFPANFELFSLTSRRIRCNIFSLDTLVEWVWQHPHASKISRNQLSFLRNTRGYGAPRSVKRKVVEVLAMVKLEPFKGLNLSVNFTSEFIHNIARGFGAIYSPTICKTRGLDTFVGIGNEPSSRCFICEYELFPNDVLQCYNKNCTMCCHLVCLKDHFRSINDADEEQGVEHKGQCPDCQQRLQWNLLVQSKDQNDTCLEKKNPRRKRVRDVITKAMPGGALQLNEFVDQEKTTTKVNEFQLDALRDSQALHPSARKDAEYNSDNWFED
ncbi:hypothetical protein PsorP6_017318 [Peronosclerospora sorghi]|uniref:Uncharacterized protein n=1 Tax=Peronosclerospora sorghi TaxID=230839 RepID=A0ACC0WLG4_9STRA|nr:hypothetical protein PsorP6_017318 [Peronosclerospora sorghi]